MTRIFCCLCVAALLAAQVHEAFAQAAPAQPPTPAPAATAPAATAPAATAPPAPAATASGTAAAAGDPAQTPAVVPSPAEQAQGFTYLAEGRRDPFVSLLRRGGDSVGSAGARAPGLSGLAVSEVSLRGTMQGQNGYVGMLLGADQKTYLVRAGDRLLDGTVQSITQDAMVIRQQINDPLSLEKQRDVRKPLRQSEAN